ncbi:MAG: hypothetical protein IJJ10_03940 [Bacillus sp. (in: Bacteria)]|nr:hypothetical protein [Bacillus sp. (in: firmicutes)]
MNWRKETRNLLAELVAEIEHGESLYDKEMFKGLEVTINKFKNACENCLVQNIKEMNEE